MHVFVSQNQTPRLIKAFNKHDGHEIYPGGVVEYRLKRTTRLSNSCYVSELMS